MGCFTSTEQSEEDKRLRNELTGAKKDQSVKKLLFLGSGGSGKSTMFKQLRTLHGTGYADKDRLQFKDHIFAQIVEQMRLCLECIEVLKEEKPDEYKDVELSTLGKEAADVVQSAPTIQVTPQIADAIETLWKEDAIRLIYDLRATMKVDHSCAYFWDGIHRIAAKDYVPNDKDILLVRYRTTGVIEQKFEINRNLFHIFDVGGQKSERKKWIHCFECVSAVLFITSLSAYDSVMFEDEEQNEMLDALQLFEQIVNNEWFIETGFILIFNKLDLFKEKIKKKSLKVCFGEDYDEDFYYNECKTDEEKINKNIQYIKDRFVQTIKDTQANVYAIETTACDSVQCFSQLNLILPVVCGEKPPVEIVVDIQSGKAPTIHHKNNGQLSSEMIIFLHKLYAKEKNKPKEEKKLKQKPEISKSEKILRIIGKFVYYLVMMLYGTHIMLLYPFLYLCFKKKLTNTAWLFQRLPIEDTFYGSSILLTTTLILLSLFIFGIYSEIQSWMVAYIVWCIYVVFYLFNRALTIYLIFSDREICGIKSGNVKASNFIIKYVVGVIVDNHTENNYTRPLSVIGGLFPALIVGLIANYALQERYTLKCSVDIVSDLCEGSICCKVISSHQIEYFYEFIGGVTSKIIASFGIVRIIGWLFCKGHPELRDIAQKMKRR